MRHLSRRHFLAGTGALGAVAALNACGIDTTDPREAFLSTDALTVVNWTEYIDPLTVERIRIELEIGDLDYSDLTVTGLPVYPDNATGFDTIIEPQLSIGCLLYTSPSPRDS